MASNERYFVINEMEKKQEGVYLPITLEGLHADVIHYIFKFLTYADGQKSTRTSKSFRHMCIKAIPLLQTFDFSNSLRFCDASSYCKHLTTIDMTGNTSWKAFGQIQFLLSKNQNVSKLKIEIKEKREWDFISKSLNPETLKDLSITSTIGVSELVSRFTKIDKLTLGPSTRVKWNQLNMSAPGLRYLSLCPRRGMDYSALNEFKNLKTLKYLNKDREIAQDQLAFPSSITELYVLNIQITKLGKLADAVGNLRVLSLKFKDPTVNPRRFAREFRAKGISPDILASLLAEAKNLEEFTVSFPQKIGKLLTTLVENSIILKNLEKMKILTCTGFSFLQLAEITPNLQAIVLVNPRSEDSRLVRELKTFISRVDLKSLKCRFGDNFCSFSVDELLKFKGLRELVFYDFKIPGLEDDSSPDYGDVRRVLKSCIVSAIVGVCDMFNDSEFDMWVNGIQLFGLF